MSNKNSNTKKSLWDHVRQVKEDQIPDYWETLSDADKRTFSTYMINRVLSMRFVLCPVVNEIQHLTEVMSDKMVCEMYTALLPPDGSYYPYISKEDKSERLNWVVEYLKKYFECSIKEAKEYYDLCINDPYKKSNLIDFIKRRYPLDEDQINELETEI